MKSFKIALAQFSPHIGNIEANTQKMLEQINEAKKQKADLRRCQRASFCTQ